MVTHPLPFYRALAKFVVDKYVSPYHTVGLGTGLAVNAVVEELARQIDSGALQVGCMAHD